MNRVTTTPEILQKKCGIEREAGRLRRVERNLCAYCEPPRPRGAWRLSRREQRRLPPRKRAFLSTMIALAMARALPSGGDRKDWGQSAARQAEMAKMAGVSAPTFSRRMGGFANHHGMRGKDPACRAGFEFLSRERQFGAPNRYAYGPDITAEASPRKNRAVFEPASPRELAENPRSGHLFDAEAKQGGYSLVPLWVNDPKLPVSESARLLMVEYIHCALMENGECHAKQETVAKAVGISVRTVRRCNKEWEELGVLRIAHSKPTVLPDGRWQRGPQIVVYLPMRTMDSETAAAEAHRLYRAKDRLQAQYAHFWDGICAVHAALLHEWTGKEHLVSAFHRAVREELARCGVPRAAIDAVVPFRSD